jgi:NAD(P)-dependent dehydrogenase (short-subunit alcohol dehydrogenase family)
MINGFGDADEIEAMCELELGRALHDGADLSDPAAIEAMMKRCAAELGAPDILVNNAGIQHVSPVERLPARQMGRDHRINLTAVFHTTRLALPAMKAKAGAGSSTPPRAHSLVASPTSRPMSPPSMASPASPRRSRWRPRATASPSTASRPAMSGRRWSRTRSPTR